MNILFVFFFIFKEQGSGWYAPYVGTVLHPGPWSYSSLSSSAQLCIHVGILSSTVSGLKQITKQGMGIVEKLPMSFMADPRSIYHAREPATRRQLRLTPLQSRLFTAPV